MSLYYDGVNGRITNNPDYVPLLCGDTFFVETYSRHLFGHDKELCDVAYDKFHVKMGLVPRIRNTMLDKNGFSTCLMERFWIPKDVYDKIVDHFNKDSYESENGYRYVFCVVYGYVFDDDLGKGVTE